MLHSDNGSTFKATTVLAMLQWLGVELSYLRPVSATTTPMPSRCSASQATTTLTRAGGFDPASRVESLISFVETRPLRDAHGRSMNLH